MCTSAEQVEIASVVNDFVSKVFMFTAFDVTKTIRAKGTRIKHGDVRDEVKRMYRDGEMQNYTTTIVDVGNSNGAPFVYHHVNTDANVYEPTWVETDPTQKNIPQTSVQPTSGAFTPATAAVGPAPVPASTSTSTNSVGSSSLTSAPSNAQMGVVAPDGSDSSPFARTRNPYKKSVTKSGRLQIPYRVVRESNLGFNVKAVVDSIDHNGMQTPALVLTSVSPCPYSVFGNYVMNVDGRIRVSKCTLSSVFDGKKNFEILPNVPKVGEVSIIAM